MAAQPSLPINHASTDWAAAEAAYRLFENPKVDAESILEPHFESTKLRAESYDKIIVIQDTTSIDFSKHQKTQGLGLIGHSTHKDYQGFHMHTTMAFTGKGLPLGLIDNHVWSRHPHRDRGHHQTKVPRSEKESFKWFRGLASVDRLKTDDKTQIITVCDREADIYELFEDAVNTDVDLVVRMQHDRITFDNELEYLKITDQLGLKKIFKGSGSDRSS